MSHAGLAIVIVGLGAWLGLTRAGGPTTSRLGMAVVIASLALAFHLIELLAS